jgi:F420-dependent oxidoreductase-like protein
MKIAIFYGGPADVDSQVRAAQDYEAQGFDGLFFGSVTGADAMTVIALAGQKTSRIELGTSVVPTYLRHPTGMAMQALATQAATGGRFTLGIGPSHKPFVEGMLGIPYDRPAVHTREYLSVLLPLLHGEPVSFRGEFFKVNGQVRVPNTEAPQVLISALAPVMLRIAGELAGGTITWMAGLRAIESHVTPRIRKAAQEAGRPEPRIMVGLPVVVTDDAAAAKEKAAQAFRVYGTLPNYQRILATSGAAGPADVAIVGNEAEVERQLRDLASAGATDFLTGMFTVGDDPQASLRRTTACLKELVGKI